MTLAPTLDHYRQLCAIRQFEQRLLDDFAHGRYRGTTHTSLGQEAVAVGVMAALQPADRVVSNHRCHGHYIARTGDLAGLVAEIAGRPDGISQGIGGSQHIQKAGFCSSGVLGGMVPHAVGLAAAARARGSDAIAVCFLGDGMLGEGIVYEAFNLAALWPAPVLFVIEANGIAQSTPIARSLAGRVEDRPAAFAIATERVDGNDLGAVLTVAARLADQVRAEGRPACLVAETTRLGPHSKGDDDRDSAQLAQARRRDPLARARRLFSEAEAGRAETEAAHLIADAFALLEQPSILAAPFFDEDGDLPPRNDGVWYVGRESNLLAHLQDALGAVMESDPDVLLLGEDVEDPYGGAFKVTRGLSTRFPGRVRSTPIAEAGIVGLAGGLGVGGFKPVVEIMFGDFTSLIIDQMLNHLAKFDRMYGGKLACPVVVRVPMGGYRGYGPTHSQSLEKLFLGIPGLIVVASDCLHDQARVWRLMLDLAGPKLYVENKALYANAMMPAVGGRIGGFLARSIPAAFPLTALALTEGEADAVLLTYGGLVPLGLEVARRVFEAEEVRLRVVVVAQLAPVPLDGLVDALGGCRRVVTLEEGTKRAGWGAEVGAALVERLGGGLRLARIGARDGIIPAAAAGEAWALPSLERCVATVMEMVDAV
jgi:2-oxoisovalerate dehydrogenase E1 component